MGERTPLALIDAPASGRMAVGEAHHQYRRRGHRAACATSSSRPTGWRRPGIPARTPRCTTRCARWRWSCVRRSASAFRSARIRCRCARPGARTAPTKAVIAPLSLIVSAFAPLADARRVLTPQLRLDAGATTLLWIDLGGGQRIGSAAPRWRRSTASSGDTCAGSRRPGAARGVLRDGAGAASRRPAARLSRPLRRRAVRRALRNGVRVALRARRSRFDGDAATRSPTLFAEELGAVVQVRTANRAAVLQRLRGAGLVFTRIGAPVPGRPRSASPSATPWCSTSPRVDLQRAWSETTHALQRLRDNPECAPTRNTSASSTRRSRACVRGSRSIRSTTSPRHSSPTGARPRIAILREQGVNGQVEMAAAFDRAGFDAYDVHMSDIIAGAASLARVQGLRRLRRVLLRRRAGRGRRLGQVDPVQRPRARRVRGVLRARRRLRARRVQRLPDDEQSARAHSRGRRTGRISCATAPNSSKPASSWSRCSVRRRCFSRHGRQPHAGRDRARRGLCGVRAVRRSSPRRTPRGACASSTIAARPTERYPSNPNGSPQGITGLTTADGRFTILMPHPERVFRTVQMSWHPREWGEDSPWMRMFRNARVWLG